jgi:drug/metabolite transporter (DMT)-like permease
MHLAVLLWGFTGVLGKAIKVAEYPLVTYRVLITAIILGAILWRAQLIKAVTKKQLIQLMLIGCIIAIHWVAFYGSIKKANITIALVCLSTASLYTALLEPLTQKQWPKLKELALSLLAIIGMAIIYKFETKYTLGIIFGLIAALLSSIFTILNKSLVRDVHPQVTSFYEMLGGLLLLILAAPLYHYYFPQSPIAPNLSDIGYLLLLAYFCTVLGQGLALSALQKISSFTAVLTVNLEPIYGIALAFIFYGEAADLSKGFYYGIGLITLSVVANTLGSIWAKRKSKQ